MPYCFRSIYLDDPIIDGRAVDIFMPERVERETAIFFVHGGGWVAGSRTGYHGIMRAFNQQGFICASTDYRLKDVTILDQITDIRHGYSAFIDMLADKGLTTRVFLHGSSAGAHLAALLAMTLPGECGEDTDFGNYVLQRTWVPPVGAALQSAPVTFEPWDDIFPPIWLAMQRIVGRKYEERPDLFRRVSPISHLSERTPPLLFMEAENEHMFLLEHTQAFVSEANACGCQAECKVYTMAEHGFFYDVGRRQQKEAFADMLSFIARLEQG